MIDTAVNAIMLTGIALVSVPVVTVAAAALVHVVYAIVRRDFG